MEGQERGGPERCGQLVSERTVRDIRLVLEHESARPYPGEQGTGSKRAILENAAIMVQKGAV